MNPPELELLDIQQAAKYLNCNPMTIRRKIKSKELVSKIKLKNGVRKYYVFIKELDELKKIFSKNSDFNKDSIKTNNEVKNELWIQTNNKNIKGDFLEVLGILEMYREENDSFKKQNKELNQQILELNFRLGQESVRQEFYQNIIKNLNIKIELKENCEQSIF